MTFTPLSCRHLLFCSRVITDSKTGAILTDANIKFLGSDGSERYKTDNSGASRIIKTINVL